MGVIYAYLTAAERQRLSQSDHEYMKQKLATNTALNQLLTRPVNWKLLEEVKCLLDRKPIARRKTAHRNGKVVVRKVTEAEMKELWK